jgi:nitrate/TMAO reductase-like tetraheme cytochrome c subunit
MHRVAILILVWLGAATAAAQTPAPPTNDDCLACHGDSSAVRASGTSVAVAADVFGKSSHAPLACVDCHADLAKFSDWPHPEKLQKVDCGSCHDENVKAYRLSVHQETAGRAEGRGAQCVDCHGSHDIRPSKDPASRTYALNLPKTCATCHSGKHLAGPAGSVAEDYEDSVHGRGRSRSGLLVSANCSSCHGSHEIRRKTDPASPVTRANIAGTCATCHEGIVPIYRGSVHGQQVAQGNTAAAVCSDCHTAHRIQRTEVSAWRLAVIDECGTCHVDRIATYRDTYHGKVTELGFTRVAACSSCHGSHNVLPASNAASMVHPQNLVTTCRQCHAQANENFVKYDPHANKHDKERNRGLYWSYRFMQGLLLGVFLFFGVHTVLWFPRSYRARGTPPPVPAPAQSADAAPPSATPAPPADGAPPPPADERTPGAPS